MGQGCVVDVVDVAAGVEVDPSLLAPQRGGGAGGGAGIDEVTEVQRSRQGAALDEADAVRAGGDAVCRAGEVVDSGRVSAAGENGGLLIGAAGGHDLAVAAGTRGDECGDR